MGVQSAMLMNGLMELLNKPSDAGLAKRLRSSEIWQKALKYGNFSSSSTGLILFAVYCPLLTSMPTILANRSQTLRRNGVTSWLSLYDRFRSLPLG